MSIHTFINGVRSRAFTYNPRVCVNGTIKKVLEGYTFLNGERHLLFGEWDFLNDHLYTSNTTVTLPAGQYTFVIRGGGGASGSRGANGYFYGGDGGCGGKGHITTKTLILSHATNVDVYVGAGGSGIGNGGESVFSGPKGGQGGDGGKPSYIIVNNNVYYADGGAGGGGGGGGSDNGRYSIGGSGGGGGGLYKFITPNQIKRNLSLNIDFETGNIVENGTLIRINAGDTFYVGKQWIYEAYIYDIYVKEIVVVESINNDGSITFSGEAYWGGDHVVATPTTLNDLWSSTGSIYSIPGQTGAIDPGHSSVGNDGVAGNQEFSNLKSGDGGAGYAKRGGYGASGGGASGAAGGAVSNHGDKSSGSGGGGAGGDNDAGGGSTGVNRPGTNGSNYRKNPTSVLTENQQYGVDFSYGQGGTGTSYADGYGFDVHNNGSQGFVLIRRIEGEVPSIYDEDLGLIDDTVSETIDCGSVADSVSDIRDCGYILI